MDAELEKIVKLLISLSMSVLIWLGQELRKLQKPCCKILLRLESTRIWSACDRSGSALHQTARVPNELQSFRIVQSGRDQWTLSRCRVGGRPPAKYKTLVRIRTGHGPLTQLALLANSINSTPPYVPAFSHTAKIS